MNIKNIIKKWGFELEKCLLPIGSCESLSFYKFMEEIPFEDLNAFSLRESISFWVDDYDVTFYNTFIDTLILMVCNTGADGVFKESVYTIIKKLNGEYFILTNHKNRNRVEGEYVETFTWSDSSGNLQQLNT